MVRERLTTGPASPLRVRPWRGDPQASLITPSNEGVVPSVTAIRDCIDQLAGAGQRIAYTGALPPAEQGAFLAAGFSIHERLHLLMHDMHDLPAVPAEVSLRKARRRDRPAVLTIDGRAFDAFWALDDAGLQEALDATPVSRFRVATGEQILGYAVCGRSGPRGYLQRLAVDPAAQHRGLGTALVADGLRWMRRRGVRSAAVNTQEGNDDALALYQHLGFQRSPQGLAVLATAMSPTGRTG